MSDRELLLQAIEAEPDNYDHRLIYADWLDERGEHDEAMRQRNYEAADIWMKDLASRHFEGYAAERPFTRDELLQAGRDYLASQKNGSWWGGLVQVGQDSLRDDVYGDELKEYWQHFETLTGVCVPDDEKTSTPFSCSC